MDESSDWSWPSDLGKLTPAFTAFTRIQLKTYCGVIVPPPPGFPCKEESDLCLIPVHVVVAESTGGGGIVASSSAWLGDERDLISVVSC